MSIVSKVPTVSMASEVPTVSMVSEVLTVSMVSGGPRCLSAYSVCGV